MLKRGWEAILTNAGARTPFSFKIRHWRSAVITGVYSNRASDEGKKQVRYACLETWGAEALAGALLM